MPDLPYLMNLKRKQKAKQPSPKKEPKHKKNALIWYHQDMGGHIALKYENQVPREGQKPWSYKEHLWDLKPLDIYLWQQVAHSDNGRTEYRLEAYEPKFGEVATPESLYDKIEWSFARRFLSSKNKLMEMFKIGLACIMVIGCLFLLLMFVDMIGKG